MLPMVFIGALLIAGFVLFTGWNLLGARELKQQHQIDSKTLFDLVKLSFGVVAGAGALVALVVAYRRQRVDEDAALRDTTRLHNERFTTAVSQLGDTSPTVRLGGVHALSGLADDAPSRELRQTCIDVLCAFLRLPYTAESDLPAGDATARHGYLALREARHTVIRLIRDHLRLPQEIPQSWQGHDFDFTSTVFDGGDLSGAEFSGGTVTFANASFVSGTVHFSETVFSGAHADFQRTVFSDATVMFTGAKFSGGIVNFYGAEFSGGVVEFNGTLFSGGMILFIGSTVCGGTLRFHGAVFNGGSIHFTGINVSDGSANFRRVTLSGGRLDFTGSRLSGGTVIFREANLRGGSLDFTGSRFADRAISFHEATYSGGTLNFRGGQGSLPAGLREAVGSPLPAGVTFADGW